MGKLFSLAIVYTPDGGRPLSLARVSDRFLLGCAAAAALRESEQQAARLRRILNLLIASEHDHLM